jgi:serine/threonine protein kinase
MDNYKIHIHPQATNIDLYTTIEFPLAGGYTLGGYQIEEDISCFRVDAPTRVYRARDVQTDQLVALKVFSLHYQRMYPDERHLQRFLRESAILQQLHHPHILPIIHSGNDSYYHWIVMPYCPLGTLADYLERRQHKPLPVQKACAFAIQMCDALHEAHSQTPPILHRDIKPQNMLFHDMESLLLCDFGIAHILSQSHLTHHHRALGTPAYMAPEQLRSRPDSADEIIDARLDVYALGCVLYEMLCGHPPFTGAPEAVAIAHLRVDPHPLHTLNSAVNQGLSLIVQRTLEKDANDRYPSAQAFAHVLTPFAED